jgi:hypothetical protein
VKDKKSKKKFTKVFFLKKLKSPNFLQLYIYKIVYHNKNRIQEILNIAKTPR